MKQGSSIFFHLLALALLAPLAWYLKANYSQDVGHFILSLGGILY